MSQPEKTDVVGQIIAYEQGTLEAESQLALFGELIRTGAVWSLQGHYGRVAQNLIASGYVTPEGAVTNKYEQETSW